METSETELSLLKYETPGFTWVRGRRCSVVHEPITSVRDRWLKEGLSLPKTDDLPVRLSNVSRNVVPHVYRAGAQDRLPPPVPQENRPSEVLFCEGESEEYQPLKDAPQAYLEFVAIGRLGPGTVERWRAGETRDTASEKLLELTVSAWPDVQQAAVRFVENHGLPRPGLLGLESYVGLPLIYFYEEAQGMAFVADILDAASRAEHDNDYDALGRMFASSNRLAPGIFKKKELEWLSNAKLIAMLELNKHLHGVTLAPTVDLWHPFRTQAAPIRILPPLHVR